ncbi:putative acyl-CoA dehydrogenase, C-terminal domain [Lyophyllum shimeji]|uniref:Acyl-CoA dehydrogenase, C-terminal domain n=1 Tax=Lyophyllum shimeji TaxID=47721 RepID=A0A9P3URG0_LYOSH|nr:putative acyl-CoA dehydrogenase, C-terminal domain [Lyophyllum shimeji]
MCLITVNNDQRDKPPCHLVGSWGGRAEMASKQFTKEEIAKHNKQGDLWIVVDSKVYDLSKFAVMHPGGVSVLLDEEVAGQDATNIFFGLHRHEVLLKPQYARLQIGVVSGEEQQIFPRGVGALSKVPYAEPTWLTPGYHTPYYKDHHRRFQAAFRKFVEEVLLPDAQLREEDGKRPSQSVFDEMARLNLIAMRLGPGKHLQGRVLMGGLVKPEEFDYFYELIMAQEVARMNARGYYDGSGGGTYIGLPPVMNFGKAPIRDKVMEEVFSGKKFICLAISEAFAGSDVAGLKTFAKRVKDSSRDGWIVSGTKVCCYVSMITVLSLLSYCGQKWITNATFSDYFTVGCRNEKGGMVVLLIERGDGVETKPIKTSYSTTAGTGYVTFDDVFVPYENTLGPDNGGLQVILSNFNHERWGMACGSIGAQRYVVEECLKWATQRQVFGKPLTSQAVIRSKLAAMIARVESAQNWIENVTYQMTHMNYKEQSTHLAGQIAFVKKYCTETAQETARDAVQIFGGRGITKTGMGRYIEHYHRTVVFDAILGGAEDVLGDLGVRQALRKMPKNAPSLPSSPPPQLLSRVCPMLLYMLPRTAVFWIPKSFLHLAKFTQYDAGHRTGINLMFAPWAGGIAPKMLVLARETVAQHNTEDDLWLIIDGSVYDLSNFASLHPGGRSVLLDEEVAGQDVTKAFFALHRSEVLLKPRYARLKIGELELDERCDDHPISPTGSLSRVPYAEPTWLTTGYHSPYYTENHQRFQTAVRKFVEEVVFPDAQAREEDGLIPSRHVFDEMARLNILAMRLGPGKHLQGRILMNGLVKPEEFDCFHELILSQELARIHARGYSDGLGGGIFIGLPPVLNFGKPALRDQIAREVLEGNKFICLAITEAFAGSDNVLSMLGLTCRNRPFRRKKWITNGTFADYFTVGCRTDGGITVLVVPRVEGVKTTPIKTAYSDAAGTAYVTFDNVFVPYENTVGPENGGLRVILSNFNHERWGLACGAVSAQRTIVEECLKWATQREALGKPLVSQGVVRSKLAAMIARVESSQNWLENITFQMTHMNYREQATYLAGQIAFLKMHLSRGAQDTARDAVQLFGGRGIARSGKGKFIEHYHRTLLIDAVGGGAEDVLGDLGVRRALKTTPRNARL